MQIPYEAGSGAAALAVNNNGKIAYFPDDHRNLRARNFHGSGWLAFGQPRPAKQGQTIVAYVTGEGDLTPSTADRRDSRGGHFGVAFA